MFTAVQPTLKLRDALIEKNFDFKSAFENNLISETQNIVSSIYLCREISAKVSYSQGVRKLMELLDAPFEGFVEKFVWKFYFSLMFTKELPYLAGEMQSIRSKADALVEYN